MPKLILSFSAGGCLPSIVMTRILSSQNKIFDTCVSLYTLLLVILTLLSIIPIDLSTSSILIAIFLHNQRSLINLNDLYFHCLT